ncbi:MAG TPA: hypothetical protein DEO85_09490 [Maritimibacter sp.]|nr:hypothetical protein [Maritimibacter sp.]
MPTTRERAHRTKGGKNSLFIHDERAINATMINAATSIATPNASERLVSRAALLLLLSRL